MLFNNIPRLVRTTHLFVVPSAINSHVPQALPTRPDDPASIIAPEGKPIVVLFIVVLSAMVGGAWWLGAPMWLLFLLGFIACALGGWCIWFFRDPQRAIPSDPSLVICSADGVIMRIDEAHLPGEVTEAMVKGGHNPPERCVRVVTFLNVFDVHVNRVPVEGAVIATVRGEGGFAHAGKPEADHNQRLTLALKMTDGRYAACTQLTGLIARRIICRAKVGERYRPGQRYGLIRFGSRTDVYLPLGTKVLVEVGQRVKGGANALAKL